MSNRNWNERYATDNAPWDTGLPSEHLTKFVDAGRAPSGRALEVGCGTGTNSLWLAAHGFDVLGLDLAPLAIEAAQAKAQAGEAVCRFQVCNFLSEDLDEEPFDFAFDRGVFHTFDVPEDRARFAERIAQQLVTGGQWLSVIGSTEGPPRDSGPPRRTARDVVAAIEPALEIVELRASQFSSDLAPQAWICLARRRSEPAQAPTGR